MGVCERKRESERARERESERARERESERARERESERARERERERESEREDFAARSEALTSLMPFIEKEEYDVDGDNDVDGNDSVELNWQRRTFFH